MKYYWDSSVLIAALQSPDIRKTLEASDSITRSQSLTEVFSTMTEGRLGFRCDANDVAKMVRQLADTLEIVEFTTNQTLNFIDQAKSKGVRGGGI